MRATYGLRTRSLRHLQIPKQTLYRWRYQGSGPQALKVGRHLRFRRADIEAFLDGLAQSDTRSLGRSGPS